MKAKLAVLLLICYAFLLARPIAPVLQDLWAHAFNSSEHMATVHYENGAMHVHVEVKDAAAHSHSSAPAETKTENLMPGFHLPSAMIELPGPAHFLNSTFPPVCLSTTGIRLALPDPPPWIVC